MCTSAGCRLQALTCNLPDVGSPGVIQPGGCDSTAVLQQASAGSHVQVQSVLGPLQAASAAERGCFGCWGCLCWDPRPQCWACTQHMRRLDGFSQMCQALAASRCQTPSLYLWLVGLSERNGPHGALETLKSGCNFVDATERRCCTSKQMRGACRQLGAPTSRHSLCLGCMQTHAPGQKDLGHR